MLVKVDGKTYINNITIINNNKKKKKKHLQQNSLISLFLIFFHRL